MISSHPPSAFLLSVASFLVLSAQESLALQTYPLAEPPYNARSPGPTYPLRQANQLRGYENLQPDRFMTTFSRDALFDLAAFHSYIIPISANGGVGGADYQDIRGLLSPTSFFDHCGIRRQPIVMDRQQQYGRNPAPYYAPRNREPRRPTQNPYDGGTQRQYHVPPSPFYHKRFPGYV